MANSQKNKILVAMSGGVDSSVSALLLSRAGFQCFGVFLRFYDDTWPEELIKKHQASEEAARRVALKLKIPFYTMDASADFKKDVIDYFLSSYAEGKTPNPCSRCNPKVKFHSLFRRAEELGADFVATGHYAQIKKTSWPFSKIKYKLFRAKYLPKDQSYFLAGLKSAELEKIIFPLHSYSSKDKVRKIADENHLPYLKKESQDICFLLGDHNDFLSANLKIISGEIRTLDNQVLGEHRGLPFYTVGQRKGIEIGGGGPYYVAKADYEQNILFVSEKPQEPLLFKQEFLVENISWISDELIKKSQSEKFNLSTQVVIRYRHEAVDCVVTKYDEGKYLVKLKYPVRAITPGQTAVFYHGNEVLGKGEIV